MLKLKHCLEKLEAGFTDSSGLVPIPDACFKYWMRFSMHSSETKGSITFTMTILLGGNERPKSFFQLNPLIPWMIERSANSHTFQKLSKPFKMLIGSYERWGKGWHSSRTGQLNQAYRTWKPH